jgi:hypothetical protein
MMKVAGWDPRIVAKNHQVMAYGYTFDDAAQTVTLNQYDPNWPGDDTAAITFALDDPDADTPLTHTCEGPVVRGIFLTEYRPLPFPPGW